MSTPTEPPSDELRALRERAYGRHADIQDDPTALARLRELEALSAAAMPSLPAGAMSLTRAAVTAAEGAALAPYDVAVRETARRREGEGTTDAASVVSRITPVGSAPVGSAPVGSAPVGSAPTAGASAGAGGDESAVAGPATAAGGQDDPPRAPEQGPAGRDGLPTLPWWRRRTPQLWVASVIAGVLLGVGATLAVQAAGSGRVATLGLDEDAPWPDSFFGTRPTDAQVFEAFHGLTVLKIPEGSSETGAQTCLYILVAPDAFGGGSCASGAFAATASLQVLPRSPDELRERFPEGTSLQFVLDGSRVHIYAREPSVIDPTP